MGIEKLLFCRSCNVNMLQQSIKRHALIGLNGLAYADVKLQTTQN